MPSQLLSLVLFGEGLLTGLTFTLMVGPVTMTILRYGIQVNRVAGVWAAFGTWISDVVFISFTYWLTSDISEWAKRSSVKLWIYIVCGLGLLLIGLLMIRTRRNSLQQSTETSHRNYVQAFIGGFLVNSLSPFTLFFWLGAAIFLHMQPANPLWYYGGLMLMLAIGDFAKAWLAPKLTVWIKEKYVYWVQVGAGVLIAATGLFIVGAGLFGK